MSGRASKKRRIEDDEDEDVDGAGAEDQENAGAATESEGEGEGWDDEGENDDDGENCDDDESENGNRFLEDEAEEDDVDGDNESEEEEEQLGDDDNHVPIARESSKAERRVQRAFALSLLEQAAGNPTWEPEELARLVALVVKELDIVGRESRIFDFLSRCSVGGNPVMLRRLQEEVHLELRPDQIGALLYAQATRDATGDRSVPQPARFLLLLDEACEQHLFNLGDRDTIEALLDVAVTTVQLDNKDLKRMCVKLCSHCGRKKTCGLILSVFTQDMPTSAVCLYVYDVIQRDFFHDLAGKMDSLYAQMPDVRAELKAHVEESFHTNAEGDLVASDEDENGNLKGFVASEDEDEEEEEEEGGEDGGDETEDEEEEDNV